MYGCSRNLRGRNEGTDSTSLQPSPESLRTWQRHNYFGPAFWYDCTCTTSLYSCSKTRNLLGRLDSEKCWCNAKARDHGLNRKYNPYNHCALNSKPFAVLHLAFRWLTKPKTRNFQGTKSFSRSSPRATENTIVNDSKWGCNNVIRVRRNLTWKPWPKIAKPAFQTLRSLHPLPSFLSCRGLTIGVSKAPETKQPFTGNSKLPNPKHPHEPHKPLGAYKAPSRKPRKPRKGREEGTPASSSAWWTPRRAALGLAI